MRLLTVVILKYLLKTILVKYISILKNIKTKIIFYYKFVSFENHKIKLNKREKVQEIYRNCFFGRFIPRKSVFHFTDCWTWYVSAIKIHIAEIQNAVHLTFLNFAKATIMLELYFICIEIHAILFVIDVLVLQFAMLETYIFVHLLLISYIYILNRIYVGTQTNNLIFWNGVHEPYFET